MATPPSSATSDDTTQKRPLTPGAVVVALLVPLVTVAGAVSPWYVQDVELDWAHRQQEACRHMPFPKTEYAAAWAGAALGVTAVVVYVLLAKRIRRRYGVRLRETKPGLVACIGVWLNVLTIPMELITLYATYSSAASRVVLGDCG